MSVIIGRASGSPLVMRKADRDVHMQVVGASGVGKSYFLEHLIREDIKRGCGVCLIDPHGEVYENIVAWLAGSGVAHGEVHLIDPSDRETAVGFNPLALRQGLERNVSEMLHALSTVWKAKNIADGPRLEKCLRITLYALAHHQLSLFEADIFTSTRYKKRRRDLVAELPNEVFRQEWAEFETYSDREFREYFESTRTRLLPLRASPGLRPILSQTKNVLDLASCMDAGHIVLVNLRETSTFHRDEAQILGALLTAALYSAARQRDVGTAKWSPFYAYIDECAQFINDNIAASLDETRKYGLHYILSHQRLEQLRKVSDDCYDAVMANTKAKVVFQVGEDESALTLSKLLFRSQFDLERPKESLNKPVAVGQEVIELTGSSRVLAAAVSRTEGSSGGRGASSGAGLVHGSSVFMPDVGEATGQMLSSTATESTGSSDFAGWMDAVSHSEAEAIGESTSETLRTVYEIMPTAVYSLDELIHFGAIAVRSLPPRNGLAVWGSLPPRQFQTPDVRTIHINVDFLSHARRALTETSRFTRAVSEVAVEQETRWRSLLHEAAVTEEPDSYWDEG